VREEGGAMGRELELRWEKGRELEDER